MREDLLLDRYKNASGYQTIEIDGKTFIDANSVKDLINNIVSNDILFGALINKYGSQVLTDEEISKYISKDFNTKVVIRENSIVKLDDL